MHNRLRREIDTYLTTGRLNDAGPMDLLRQALSALGGPVQDNRPHKVMVVNEGLTSVIEQAKVALVESLLKNAWSGALDETPAVNAACCLQVTPIIITGDPGILQAEEDICPSTVAIPTPVVGEVIGLSENIIVQGRDPGDETEYAPGLGIQLPVGRIDCP